MNRTTETLGNATGKTGWRKTYARNWTPPAQPCGAWGRKMKPDVQTQALQAFGADRQVDKCIEELGELATVLVKYRHGEATAEQVIDELADVAVTTGTLALLFDKGAIEARIAVKLARLQKLVADQVQAKVAATAKPEPAPVKPVLRWAEKGARTAAYVGGIHAYNVWQGLASGLWYAAKSDARNGDRAYQTKDEAMDYIEKLVSPKPVRPALCWSKWQDGYLLLDGTNWRGYVGHLNGRWAADMGTNDRQWFADSASAMREIERRNGLDEVPLWT